MEPKKKTGYASNTQTRRLVELLDADSERSGKFTPVFTYKTAQKRWTSIADELNSIGGAHKTWSEWRKTYQDKKAKTKKKASAQHRSARMTGCGSPVEELNNEEHLLLASIVPALISGHSECKESTVQFKDMGSPSELPTNQEVHVPYDRAEPEVQVLYFQTEPEVQVPCNNAEPEPSTSKAHIRPTQPISTKQKKKKVMKNVLMQHLH